MRILHTSDWHLGVSTGPASRLGEQERFLEWLLEALTTREIDALIVAGDIFDSMHPSAEAQELYYRFLSRVSQTGVRNVVIVGGNHDSPSRLDAVGALLETVNVHVVGGLPTGDARLSRMVVPLRARGSETIAAVCLAVPYIHEYRLGIRTTNLNAAEIRTEFGNAFAGLYTQLADHARARFPDIPIIATGHLTLGSGTRRSDYPQEIHQVGTIEGLPLDLLDPRIQYTALGHIHRCFPITGSSAWYCGSPIPYSITEMSARRRVLQVELQPLSAAIDDGPAVEQIEVPRLRDLVQLAGPPEDVLASLAELQWSTPLPPLVYVRVETQLAEPGLTHRLQEAAQSHTEARGRPILVEVRLHSAQFAAEAVEITSQSLDELHPEQVFGLMCDSQRLEGPEREELVSAFNTVAGATEASVEAMVSAIKLPYDEQEDAP